MTKICSHCLSELPLDAFSSHPTAAYGRKHICKKCDSAYSKKRYEKKLAEKGKSRAVRLGGIVEISTAKRGDVREDGCVFVSKRKVAGGFQEWWVSPEKFKKITKRMLERINWRYHNDPDYRKRADARNTSEAARARKRSWNKRNRHVLSSWHAERRAMMRGVYSNLTKEEKKRVADWYLFRDALNRVHGKTMFHVDHKKAIARGGRHHPDNLQVTTATYNVKKFVNAKPKD